jgi:hypothetical protein
VVNVPQDGKKSRHDSALAEAFAKASVVLKIILLAVAAPLVLRFGGLLCRGSQAPLR